jgi:hypothetical protein
MHELWPDGLTGPPSSTVFKFKQETGSTCSIEYLSSRVRLLIECLYTWLAVCIDTQWTTAHGWISILYFKYFWFLAYIWIQLKMVAQLSHLVIIHACSNWESLTYRQHTSNISIGLAISDVNFSLHKWPTSCNANHREMCPLECLLLVIS